MNINFITNDDIESSSVRIVQDPNKNGVFAKKEALDYARRQNLDLVQISDGDPAICRVVSIDRFRYEKTKTDRELARRQKLLAVETKEMQLRPVTSTADLSVKARKTQEFLDQGNKVKIIMRFRGRERTHKEEAIRVVDEFIALLGEHRVERGLKDTDGDMIMVLASVKNKAEILKKTD